MEVLGGSIGQALIVLMVVSSGCPHGRRPFHSLPLGLSERLNESHPIFVEAGLSRQPDLQVSQVVLVHNLSTIDVNKAFSWPSVAISNF